MKNTAEAENQFGEALRTLRKSSGDTQGRFAERLGFSQTFLSDVESGRQKPGFEFLKALKREMGVSLDRLINVQNENENVYGKKVVLPLFFSPVSAGQATPAGNECEKMVEIEGILVPSPESSYMVQVSGDSMRGAGIETGDTLICDRSIEPRDGHIVVAVIDGETTVKRYRQSDGRRYLYPENDQYPVMNITDRDVVVQGVVVRGIREY